MGARTYQPGEQIRGTVYRVVRHIATGGMGSVFDVEDVTVGKRYVLKTLHPDLFGRNDLARRMEQEARVLARLQHPNIVEVVTAGETQDEMHLPYYVMERLNGQNLRTVLEKKGALDRIHAYRIGIDLLDALAHAHDNGVIHRDVKPENVFLHRNLNGTTTTKLLDFGIMRLLDGASGKSETMGRFVGTMRYASPEQVMVKPLTPMTDVYSAGLVVYEMLAGQGPYDDIRDLVELGRAHMHTPPPPLSRFVSLPREAEVLVMSSLAKDPGHRPKDAFAFGSELRRVLRDAESSPVVPETRVNPLSATPSQVAPGQAAIAPTRHEPLVAPAQGGARVAVAPMLSHGGSTEVSGSEATMLVPPTVGGSGASGTAPTMASPGIPSGTLASAGGGAVVGTEPPTVVNQPGHVNRVVPLAMRPTLPSSGLAPYAPASVGVPSTVGVMSAPPQSPNTALMAQPPPQRPPMGSQPPSNIASNMAPTAQRPPMQSHPGFAYTAQPATPQMSNAPRPGISPMAAVAPPPAQMAAPQMGGVDRNADTRAYQQNAGMQAPPTDTQRVDEQGRTVGGPMELRFPRGHGELPQSSTGGVEAPISRRRKRRSPLPAIVTGASLAFVALIPTGFGMNKVMSASAAGGGNAMAPLPTMSLPPETPTPTPTASSTLAPTSLGQGSAPTPQTLAPSAALQDARNAASPPPSKPATKSTDKPAKPADKPPAKPSGTVPGVDL